VVRVLDRLVDERDRPVQLVLDNGPELISRALDSTTIGNDPIARSATKHLPSSRGA
jgi:hypothetical protein